MCFTLVPFPTPQKPSPQDSQTGLLTAGLHILTVSSPETARTCVHRAGHFPHPQDIAPLDTASPWSYAVSGLAVTGI